MKRFALPARIAVAAIRGYQRLVSPWRGATCRFVPTCSQYAIEAIEKRGVFIGIAKGAWRILRCNPFVRGGYDPV